MTNTEKVIRAMDMHGLWIKRLRQEIEVNGEKFNSDQISKTDQCEFGKWLYNDFPESFRQSQLFYDIETLHAKFHVQAAEVVTLARSGKKEEALKLMASGGDFMNLSGTLVLRMSQLKSDLAGI